MKEVTKAIDQAVKTMTNREGKYLTFSGDCKRGIVSIGT